jgi:hypothetical protein
MNPFSMAGALVVILALISYSYGFFNEQKQRRVSLRVLRFYLLGIILDFSATVLMILGSSNGMVTLHGFIGYSSFLAMLTDTIWLIRFYRQVGANVPVTSFLHGYSRFAYIWWVAAFITGGLLVALR